MGFLRGKCSHCGNEFFFKVTLSGVQVDILQDLPEGVPCMTLDEAKPVEPPAFSITNCAGCEDDFYNDHNPMGVKKCWSVDTAKMVMKKEVSSSQRPPWTQSPRLVPSCFHRNGCIYVDPDRTC
jgi:hypothetical protein